MKAPDESITRTIEGAMFANLYEQVEQCPNTARTLRPMVAERLRFLDAVISMINKNTFAEGSNSPLVPVPAQSPQKT